jgi:hypothetical protein
MCIFYTLFFPPRFGMLLARALGVVCGQRPLPQMAQVCSRVAERHVAYRKDGESIQQRLTDSRRWKDSVLRLLCIRVGGFRWVYTAGFSGCQNGESWLEVDK